MSNQLSNVTVQGLDLKTELLRQQLQQTSPQDIEEAFLNVPIEPVQIVKVHTFPSRESAEKHLAYVKDLDQWSFRREQAAMEGDREMVEKIDAEISECNRRYRESL